MVSWPQGNKKPQTRQLHSTAGAGAMGGAFWGFLSHLAREATVRDVETTRYGRHYAGCRGKITHVDKDHQTGAATGYVIRMEDGGNEVRFEPEELRIIEAWD